MPLINASTILDYLDSCIICLNSDPLIKQVNSTAEVFFDNSSKALVDKPFDSLFDQRYPFDELPQLLVRPLRRFLFCRLVSDIDCL